MLFADVDRRRGVSSDLRLWRSEFESRGAGATALLYFSGNQRENVHTPGPPAPRDGLSLSMRRTLPSKRSKVLTVLARERLAAVWRNAAARVDAVPDGQEPRVRRALLRASPSCSRASEPQTNDAGSTLALASSWRPDQDFDLGHKNGIVFGV